MSSRRKFIRNGLLGAVAVKQAGLFAQRPGPPAEESGIIGHGDFKYRVDKHWARIGAASTPLLNCHEMVQDSKGRLIMLGDNTHNNVLVFDKSGKLLDSWGTSFPGGHGLTMAREGGEDALFITDCGWYLDRDGQWRGQSGQVVKMTVDGQLIFSLGHPRTIGVYADDEKFKPTETAIAPNGDIYVADGYGSDYVLHYDAKGRFIAKFGGHKNTDPDQNLHNAHGVAFDLRDPSRPLLVCTSREENCFKWFTPDGKFVKKLVLPGMYVCRAVLDGKDLYAGVCWSKDASGKQIDTDSGFLTILDGADRVVSSPGGTPPFYKGDALQQTFALPERVFQHGHDVCVDDEKNLYVCQWNANQTPPVKLTRV